MADVGYHFRVVRVVTHRFCPVSFWVGRGTEVAMQYCRSNLLAAQLPRPSGTRCQISTRKMAHAIANSSIRISENMRASLSRHQCRLLRVRSDAPTLQRCQALLPAECHSMRQQQQCSRRELVLLPGGIATALAMMAARPGSAMAAQDITIIDDEPGFGQSPVRLGDLVLVHYTGMTIRLASLFSFMVGSGNSVEAALTQSKLL